MSISIIIDDRRRWAGGNGDGRMGDNGVDGSSMGSVSNGSRTTLVGRSKVHVLTKFNART